MEIRLSDIVVPILVRHIVDKTTQEYKDFVTSIQVRGVINPVIVSPIENVRYRLVAGLVRYEASIDAGKVTIPAQVKTMTDEEIEEMQLIACTHKVETSRVDYAKALKSMLKRISIEELALKLNKSVSWIKEHINE